MRHSAVILLMQEPHQQHNPFGNASTYCRCTLCSGTLASSASGTFLIPQSVNLLVLPRRNDKEFIQPATLFAFSFS